MMLNSKSMASSCRYGSTLEEVMEVQSKVKPGLEIPWIVTALAEEILKKNGAQTEGIFR